MVPPLTFGRNCSSHDDCNHDALQCYDHKCSCLTINGYVGQYCSKPSALTHFSRATIAVGGLLWLILFWIELRMIRNSIGHKLSVRKKTKRYVMPLNSAEIQMNDGLRMKKKFNTKDRVLFFVLFHLLSTAVLPIGRICTLSFDSTMAIERSLRPFALPFVFLTLNLTQLQVGLAWMEAGLKIKKLGFIRKRIKHIKRCVNGLCFIEIIVGFILGIKGKYFASFVTYQIFVVAAVGLIVVGGRYLQKNMLRNGASDAIISEGTAIGRAVLRMSMSLFLFEIFLVLLMAFKYKNGLFYNITNFFVIVALDCYGLSLLNYLDQKKRTKRSVRKMNAAKQLKDGIQQ